MRRGELSCRRDLYHISDSHTTAAAPRARFDSQLAAQPRKGQKQRGQLVFSQLICQSGPQTSERITVILPDRSGRRGDEGAAAQPRLVAPHPPITLTSLWAKNSDGPGHFAQDHGSASDGGRARCHSSRADVTWSLRCGEGGGGTAF